MGKSINKDRLNIKMYIREIWEDSRKKKGVGSKELRFERVSAMTKKNGCQLISNTTNCHNRTSNQAGAALVLGWGID